MTLYKFLLMQGYQIPQRGSEIEIRKDIQGFLQKIEKEVIVEYDVKEKLALQTDKQWETLIRRLQKLV